MGQEIFAGEGFAFVRGEERERLLVGEENTNLEGENKSDFRAGVKVAESGIFRWLDVYYLVMVRSPWIFF